MKGETGLKLFKKTCWLLGFLPAVIGGGLIWHIWDNMRMTSMLTDILTITAVGILAAGLTVSAVAALLVVSRYLCEKGRARRTNRNPFFAYKPGFLEAVKTVRTVLAASSVF